MNGMQIWLIFTGFIVFAGISVFLNQKRNKKYRQLEIQAGFGKRNETPVSEEIMASMRAQEREVKSFEDRNAARLDEITWNDLELDALFQSMNRTMTSSGQEMLYFMLHQLIKDQTVLCEREKKIVWFSEQKEKREKIQMQLSFAGKLPRHTAYEVLEVLKMAVPYSCVPHAVMACVFFLTAVGTLVSLFVSQVPVMPFAAALIGSVVWNIGQYYKKKGELDCLAPALRYILRLTFAGEKLLLLLKNEEVWEKEYRALSDAVTRVKKSIKHSWLVLSGQSMSGNPADILLDYFRMILHMDLIQFSRMMKKLKRDMDSILSLYEIIGRVDALIAMTSFRNVLSGIADCSIPEFCDDSDTSRQLFVQNVFHPMMEHPVTNSFTVDHGILVTGSNASGKSTFLKSVALCAIFAQTLHLCPASRYRAPLYSVMTSMALRDHLASNESYYIVETRSLKRIMDEAKKGYPVLVVIDEILRGTNTVERIASSAQILNVLNSYNTMVLAATHDVELADIMAEHYENFHFQEEIVGNEIQFDYRLRSGKAVSRNAIRLLEQLGFDKQVTKNAEQMAEQFEKKKEWDVIE